MTYKQKAKLVLEDGSCFEGVAMGAEGEWVGEVVFNTSMTGYQEIITDPSYWGQMVCFTCPHIGNVGVNLEDVESRAPYVRAVLARQICEQPSNWRSQQSLPDYLQEHGAPALSGLDTRRLTLILRDHGVMRAALSTTNLDTERLHSMARNAADMSELAPVGAVSREAQEAWTEDVADIWIAQSGLDKSQTRQPHVVVIDCGIKHNIMRLLAELDARVTVVPWNTSAQEILALKPDGVLISNGPGDPRQVPEAVGTAKALIGQTPIFGICLGHQILGQALGGRIFKLPFGHHGGNHPVQDLTTGKVEITAQNHNYALDPESLEGLPVVVTHRNLYDGTIEGLRHTSLPVSCVQYHPEASPGPHDALYILRRFIDELAI